MKRIYKTQTLPYAALCDCLINLRRDINEILPFFGAESKVLGVEFHTPYL